MSAAPVSSPAAFSPTRSVSSNTKRMLAAIATAAIVTVLAPIGATGFATSGRRRGADAIPKSSPSRDDGERSAFGGRPRTGPTDAERMLEIILGGEGTDGKKIIDDDKTRDATCKAYLMRFLNGTTDSKDECDGMVRAYDVADCKGEIGNQNQGGKNGQKGHHVNAEGYYGYEPDDDGYRESEYVGSVGDYYFPFLGVGRHKKQTKDGKNVTINDDALIDDTYEEWKCCDSIKGYYVKNCHDEGLASWSLLVVMLVMVLCGVVKSMIRVLKLQWIPDAAGCILVGAVVGFILHLAIPERFNDDLPFDNDLFLHVLLPPIIFESALTIDKRAFRRDLFPILTFAVAGTIFSAFATGAIVFGLSSVGDMTSIPMLDSLIFGALISSIDPVATLGMLTSMGVRNTDTLYVLVFGESLLNDGVAIVLFHTLVDHLGDDAVIDGAAVGKSILNFLTITFGSIAIGVGCGVVCTFYYWKLRGKHSAVVEVAMFFCWALVPYYISDGVEWSGIISIMAMGFVLDVFVVGRDESDEEEVDGLTLMSNEEEVYVDSGRLIPTGRDLRHMFSGKGHLTRQSQHHVKFVAEVISNLMETAIFAYLGMFLFSSDYKHDLRLNSTAVFACIVSRVAMVVVVSLVINIFVAMHCEARLSRLFRKCCPSNEMNPYCVKRNNSLQRPKAFVGIATQTTLIFAGVRGAVSLALVEITPLYNSVTGEGSEFKSQLKAMTTSSILFTVFVFGASTYVVLKQHARGQAVAEETDSSLNESLVSAPGLAQTRSRARDLTIKPESRQDVYHPETSMSI